MKKPWYHLRAALIDLCQILFGRSTLPSRPYLGPAYREWSGSSWTRRDPEDELPPEFLLYLVTEGYLDVRPIGNRTYAAIMPLAVTAAIVTGAIGNRYGYDDRWCYMSVMAARQALAAWDGQGEPAGWHRHPATGRRRPDGNPHMEYVHP